jgi:hypothetical protein
MSSDLSSRRTIKPTKQINAKKSPSLPQETVEYLKAWMMSPEHIAHPYPTEQEKAQIMAETGIELKQLTNWFVNNRKRFWKPRVEAKLSVEEGSLGRLIPAAQANGSFQGRENEEGHNNGVRPAPRFVEDPHTVSEGGSVVSSSSCRSAWSDDEEDCNKSSVVPQPATSMYRNGFVSQHSKEGSIRREVVDVHVLYPEVMEGDVNTSAEVLPTLRDVTIKSNVKKEMVLATFPKCLLQYSVPVEIENDRKKVCYLSSVFSDIVSYLFSFADFLIPRVLTLQSAGANTPRWRSPESEETLFETLPSHTWNPQRLISLR